MIKSSKIYNELSIYTDNKIVLWGAGFFGKQYLEKLRWFEINVVAFCDNNKEIHGIEIDGVPVISPDELQEMLKENDDIVVQIACETDEEILVRQLQNIGVVNYISKNDMEHNISYFKKYSDIDFDAKFPGNSDGNHIRLTKIDSEFSIYKNNKMILWGAGKFGRQMLDLFRYYKLEVEAFCDNNEKLHGTKVDGVIVISPNDVKKLIDNGEKIMVQISYGDREYNSLYKQLENINIANYVNYKEAVNIFTYIRRCNCDTYSIEKTRANLNASKRIIDYNNNLKEYIISNFNKPVLLICMPGKTGDTTLHETFKISGISYFNTDHLMTGIDSLISINDTPIKIITAVREPISIILSEIYQVIASCPVAERDFRRLVDIYYPYEKSVLLKNGGDFQYIFDKFIKNIEKGNSGTRCENFTNGFCEKVLDIKNGTFDKEKGYKIVKNRNVEVFIYQLEKMNDIVKEVAEFVGGDFTEWEMGNVASDKWIADSYKQAQREIKFSQEYFDKCFNESYVNHFYSEEDIEKFKERWRSHIR